MSLTALYHCPLCTAFGADSYLPVLRHIKDVHSFQAGFAVTCEIDGCQSTFRKFSAYKSHFYRKHRHTLAVATLGDDADRFEECWLEWCIWWYGGRWTSPARQQRLVAWLLREVYIENERRPLFESTSLWRNGLRCLTVVWRCCDQSASVCETCVCVNYEELLKAVDDVFHDESNTHPFLELSTQHLQHKYFKEKFALLVCLVGISRYSNCLSISFCLLSY